MAAFALLWVAAFGTGSVVLHSQTVVAKTHVSPAIAAHALEQKGALDVEDAEYYAAYPLLLQAANFGDAAAKRQLGLLYRDGHGTVYDPHQALQWLQEAALGGNTQAYGDLGQGWLATAFGTSNSRLARFWLLKSQQAKEPVGTLALAEMSCNGTGVAKDIATCGTLLLQFLDFEKKADRLDYSVKQRAGRDFFNIGVAYAHGDGVAADPAAAQVWWQHGAALGDQSCYIALHPGTPPVEAEGAGMAPEVAPATVPISLERYPNLQAPNSAHEGEDIGVTVSLDSQQADALTKILNGANDNGKLQIVLPAGMTSVEIEVNLFAADFEIEGSNVGTLVINQGDDFSAPATFTLKVNPLQNAPLPSNIQATLYCNHKYLARIERPITLLPAQPADPHRYVGVVPPVVPHIGLEAPLVPSLTTNLTVLHPPDTQSTAPQSPVGSALEHGAVILGAVGPKPPPTLHQPATPGIMIDPTQSAPDIVIEETLVGGTLSFIVSSRYLPTVQGTVDAQSLQDFVAANYADLATRGRKLVIVQQAVPNKATQPPIVGESPAAGAEADDVASGFGEALWQKFVPQAFKTLYYQLKSQGVVLQSIQVVSDDPEMPWELLRPSPDAQSSPEQFLGLSVPIARWLTTGEHPQPPTSIPFTRLVAVAPIYQGAQALTGTQAEVAALSKVPQFDSKHIDRDYNDIRRLAANLPDGIIHFAGHGGADTRQSPPQFALGLSPNPGETEADMLSPATWHAAIVGAASTSATASSVTCAAGKNCTHIHNPFYFFNACEVGETAVLNGTVDGWAQTLLDSGASGYLGALWAVSDTTAEQFSANFYTELAKRIGQNSPWSVADVVTKARLQTYTATHDPTALAYILYADPYLKLVPPNSMQ